MNSTDINSTDDSNFAIDGFDDPDGAADEAWRATMRRLYRAGQSSPVEAKTQSAFANQDEIITNGLQSGTAPDGLLARSEAWFRSAALGDLEAMQQLVPTVDRHGGLNGTEDSSGLTALGLAASGGHRPVVQWLLEQGVWPYYGGRDGESPLQLAIRGSHQEMAGWLIEQGADLNQLDQNGIGPLHAAAQVGDLAIAKLLIERGAIPRGGTPYGIVPAWSPLLLAIRHGHLAIVQLLVAYGVAIPQQAPDGQSILQLALESENAELVSWLHSRF